MDRALVLETLAIYRHADALYAGFRCGGTAECCQLSVTGREPWLWPSEWLVLRAHLAKAPVAELTLPAPATGPCPFLRGGRCAVYAARPLGCRTFFCARARGGRAEPALALARLAGRLAAINLATAGGQAVAPRPLRAYTGAAPRHAP